MKNLNIDFETLDLQDLGQWPGLVKFAVLLGSFCLIAYVGYSLQVEKSWVEFETKSNQCKVLIQELDNIEKLTSHYPLFKEKADKLGLTLAFLRRQIPEHYEEAGLLKEISEQALQCRLHIRSVKPESEILQGTYLEHPIMITMSGDFQGLGEFASRLASMSPMISLQDYTLIQNKELQILDIQLLLKTYRTIEGQDLASLEKNSIEASGSLHTGKGELESEKTEEDFGLESMPEMKIEEVYSYQASKIRSPFEKANLSSLDKPAWEIETLDPNSTTRPKELLELYPLDSLKMVGFIERDNVMFGLLKDSGGNIHRVKIGDYIGQNEGKIITIQQTGIEVQENLRNNNNNYNNNYNNNDNDNNNKENINLTTTEKAVDNSERRVLLPLSKPGDGE
jgi:Tfp pilus assembly protein PilO/Tfp pilus assembly protein PilP